VSTNDGERFRTLSRLFDELVDLEPGARDPVIRERCAGDPELEREIRALLEADETGDPDAFVAGIVGAEAAAITSGPNVQGARLGSWRLERPLGVGGMGTVYLATRADGEYEASAAIKLVRGGALSPGLAERFRAERQILAGLSHPGVAQLLDGGSTEDGTPYLVMELVDGRPVTDWCEEHGLDVEARLALFLKVCEAVAYAHGALVAHRDLKPSNILVTAEGEPKLLDFGIAKLVDAVAEGADGHTRSHGAMTPSYASPEQVAGERAGVAADIYALGVLLFELLAGRLPIDTRGLTPAQIITKVGREIPPVVSAATEDPARRRRLSGDLDAIVSRSLRKEPEQRYPSVEALADDVRLHLSGMPIKARRDDWAYRTGKAVRRNLGAVSAGALMLVLMVSFTINAVMQARAVAQERDRAESERETAERVIAFLEELLTEADPNVAAGEEITARQVLDRGAERVLEGLDADPEVQSALAVVMGRVYRRLGEYHAAGPLLDSALAVRSRLETSGSSALGQSLIERAALAYDEGAYERALELARDGLEVYRAAAEGDDARVASAMDWMSASLMELGRMEEAQELSEGVVEIYRRLDPEPHPDLATSLTALSDVYRGRGSFDDALRVGREALAMSRALYGDRHLEVAFALNQLASTLNRAGRPEEAVRYVEEGLAIRQAIFPDGHVETAASLGNLANIYAGLGRMDEALAARRESVEVMRSIFPGAHPYVAASVNSLGGLLAQMGRYDEAEPLLVESVDLHRLAFPPALPNLGHPLTSLGRIYLDQERFTEAERVLREAYHARSGGLPQGHWHIAASGLELGRALDALGREVEAEAKLVESHAILLETFGAADDRTLQARDALHAHWTRRGMGERVAELERG
jgi:eukaryotic-like serine/threonine-protein kinase